MPQPSMIRTVVRQESTGKTRRIGVSLPLVTSLRDDPAYQPQPADLRPARHRNPSLKSLVRLAVQCDSATELGEKLRQRYERKRRREPSAAEDAELDKLFGGLPSELTR